MTHQEKIAQWIGPGKIGTEIGPGRSPLPGLDPPPIYVDCFREFGNSPCVADYYGHARALPFQDDSLDYVLASHVLEHVANPVAALEEWHRVLRPGGIIYLVVPDRRVTWDRGRTLTPVEHLLADYVAGTTASDSTHIDEFVHGVEWSEWSPGDLPAEVAERKETLAQTLHGAVGNGEEINIHFHTFEPSNVRDLLQTLTIGGVGPNGQAGPLRPAATESDRGGLVAPAIPRFNWEIVDSAAGFPADTPNGVLAILRVHKTWRARADAEASRLRNLGRSGSPLRPDAVPFAEWAAKPASRGGPR